MAYSLLVSTGKQSPDSQTVTTNAIDTTGADFIVIGVHSFNGQPTLTDSKSNSWVDAGTFFAANDIRIRIRYAFAPTVGSGHTFSVSGGTTFPTLSVAAFSGSVTSPLDQNTGSASTTGVTTISTGSITPTQDNELIVAVMSLRSVTTSMSIDNSMSLIVNLPNDGAHAEGGFMAWKAQTTAAAINPAFSWSTSSGYAVMIASFKAAAPAGRIYKLAGDGGGLAGEARGLAG